MANFNIKNLEEKIEWLARLVTNGGTEDQRFRMAVAEFKVFLEDVEKNHLPRDLADALRNKNRFIYDNQQSYVDDLRREYKDYCKRVDMKTIENMRNVNDK